MQTKTLSDLLLEADSHIVAIAYGGSPLCGRQQLLELSHELRTAAATPDLQGELVAALRGVTDSLDLTIGNIACEIKRDERAASNWEGVPELLLERVLAARAVLAKVEGK